MTTYEKAEGLENTPARKRRLEGRDSEPPAKRFHGCHSSYLGIDQESLLEEASRWEASQVVNWSQLARRYEVTKRNGVQIIKGLLKAHKIPAAMTDQRTNRALRRKRKTLPGGVPFPMGRPSNHHKGRVDEMVQSGEILIGQEVVESSYDTYSINRESNSIVSVQATLYA